VKKKHLTGAAEIVYAGIDAIDPVEGPRMFPVGPIAKPRRNRRRFLAIYRDQRVEITIRPAGPAGEVGPDA
jgi:hypothetical protein